MKLEELITKTFRVEKKYDNLRELIRCAKSFHKHAKIDFYNFEGEIVVESGHQPNFLPYAGTFKKAFLQDFLASFGGIIPLFGIYDYNQATAKWLYQNRVPDINKNGFKKIGFKISKKDMWRRFDSLPKPSKERWEEEIEKIKKHYGGKSEDPNLIEEELWISFELGENFADVNAILFARLCQHLGIKVNFFKYSDVQKRKIFFEEWKEISENIERFNSLYNSIISKRNLTELSLNKPNLAPFWYLCNCGGNVPLYHLSEFKGKCPVCGRVHEFEDLAEAFDRLSPRAVFRNLVYTMGIETSLFISGSGGSLRYGIVSNDMYSAYGIRKPITLYWRSKDLYPSPIYKKIISQISGLFGCDLLAVDIEKIRGEWAKKIEEGDEESKGKYIYSDTLLQIAEKAFSLNHSIVDLILSLGFERIRAGWRETLENAVIDRGEFYSIEADVDFGYRGIYAKIKELAKKSRKIDPIGLID